MKKILLALFLVLFSTAVMAQASPTLVCDPAPTTDAVTFAQVTVNGTAGSWIPYVTQTFGGVLVCVLQDLGPLANGSHTITAKFRNQWGDSVASVPFTFVKGLPKVPSGMSIK